MLIKIMADTKQAVDQIENLSEEIENLGKELKKTGEGSGKGVAEATKGFDALTTSVKGLVAGLGAIAIAQKGIEFAKMAADAEQSADAFERVFESLGLDAVAAFDKIKEASKKAIDTHGAGSGSVRAIAGNMDQ